MGNLLLGSKILYKIDDSAQDYYLAQWAYIAKTADYTATVDDFTIDCNGTFTVTLPTAVGIKGKPFKIKNSGSGIITVDTTDSELIDGSLTITLEPGFSYQVQSTNFSWIII